MGFPLLRLMLHLLPPGLALLVLHLLVTALLCLPLPVAAAATEDLLSVYAQARAADPLLAGADAQRGVQREALQQARAALLPQWQIDASDQLEQPGSTRSHQLGSSISQVLFDLGRLRNRDVESTLLSAQDERYRAAEQDLCARVARAYFGVLSAEAALAATLANEDALAAQAAQAQARFQAGLSAQVDVEQARAYHALSRSGTVQARQALADARAGLAEITGRAPGALAPLRRELPALPPDPAEPQPWVEQALRANPLLQAQARAVDASQQRISAARAAHWPTVSLGLDSDRRGGSGVADSSRGRTDSVLALRLSLPLFAGGATESGVRQATFQRDAQREALEAARRALARETQAQHLAVLSGLQMMDSTRAALAAAQQALVSTRTGQALGTRSLTDLLLAIQTQNNAQNAYDQARHGYVLARLLLQQAAGALGQAELAAVNSLLQETR